MENLNSLEHKNRLDVEMLRRAIARSRSSAADLIKRGKVTVNGIPASKPSAEVREADDIRVVGVEQFVSRAGEKLAHALDAFSLDVQRLTVLDIGSSTGGFVDCLIRRGASKVIAVDVGVGQLDASLRSDPRVEVNESTDIRKFSLPSPADMATIDVSFISLEHILPKAFESVKKGGSVVALVKPQFEVGKEIADKNRGVIASDIDRAAALDRVKSFAKKSGFKIANETVSPIEGEKGNKEFLLLLKK